MMISKIILGIWGYSEIFIYGNFYCLQNASAVGLKLFPCLVSGPLSLASVVVDFRIASPELLEFNVMRLVVHHESPPEVKPNSATARGKEPAPMPLAGLEAVATVDLCGGGTHESGARRRLEAPRARGGVAEI